MHPWAGEDLSLKIDVGDQTTVLADWDETLTQEKRSFFYFHHLFKNLLEQMISHLKALI